MAYVDKYRMDFIDNASDYPVRVIIQEDGWTGGITQLTNGGSPVIVTENQSNESIFGIRAKSITLQIISDGDVSIEDFLSPNENKYRVEVYVNNALWLVSFILTDQLSESWYTDGTKHYVKLTATDNLGAIKDAPLLDISGNSYVPSSKQLLSTIVKSALEQAVPGLDLVIYDNLFAVGQTSRGVSNTLDAYQQTRVDMRTFVTNFTQFESAYNVLEKILLSRKSVLLQHNGEWVIVRVQELFTGDTIPGTRYLSGGGVEAVTFDYSATLSATGDVNPVSSFMLKRYKLPVLRNRCQYNYRPFDEIVCNQNFERGSATAVFGDLLREYNIDCWDYLKGAIVSTTPSTQTFVRRLQFLPSNVTENYVVMGYDTSSGGESFMKSEPFQVNKDDQLQFQVSRRLRNNYPGSGTEVIMRILLYSTDDATYYTLDGSGNWVASNSTFTINTRAISHTYLSTDGRTDWIQKDVTSKPLPRNGVCYVLIYNGAISAGAVPLPPDTLPPQETYVRDFNIKLIPYVEGKLYVPVTGDYDQLSITGPKSVNDYEVFLSDSPKFLFKGAMFLENGTTLTTLWYEWPNVFVQYPVKRWNAIAEWRISYINRMRVEADTRRWLYADGEPIHPVAKITAANGAPTKRFIPANITDVDLSNSTGRMELLEVQDTTEVIQPTIVFAATFAAATDTIVVTVLPSNYMFYIGDQYQITGTTSNNLTFTVTSVTPGINGSYTIGTNAALTNETATAASFKLLTNSQKLVDADHEFSYIYGRN